MVYQQFQEIIHNTIMHLYTPTQTYTLQLFTIDFKLSNTYQHTTIHTMLPAEVEGRTYVGVK